MLLKQIKKIFNWKNFKNSRISILVVGCLTITGLAANSAVGVYGTQNTVNEALVAIETTQDVSEAVEVTTQTEVVEVAVPFTEARRASTTLNSGETQVVQKGANGVRRETYEITYENGEKASRVLIASETVKQPVAQIVEIGGASAVLASRGDTDRYSKVYTMTATGYDACSLCGTGSGKTATGLEAKRGVVAVDPKVIPLGSRVYVESPDGSFVYGTAIAADTGGAIKGNKIDLCFATHSEALQFGRRTVKVYVE